MSWIITGSFAQPDEPEALDYIAAVEAADGQTLEDGVKFAYNSFIKGCKADGIWDAIKASCILAGAKTLDGALVPLVGTAPTNFNFVSGDYDRETGLLGNGSNKYLNSGRANNADPQNSIHLACFVSSSFSNSRFVIASAENTSFTSLYKGSTGNLASYLRGGTIISPAAATMTTGFFGSSRTSGTSINARYSGVSVFNISSNSASPSAEALEIFRSSTYPSLYLGDGRLAFYSIGESLDLALLDARVTTLMSDLAAAIP